MIMILKRKTFGVNSSIGLTAENAARNVSNRNLIAARYKKELAEANKQFKFGHHDYNVYMMERNRIKKAMKSEAANSYETILAQQEKGAAKISTPTTTTKPQSPTPTPQSKPLSTTTPTAPKSKPVTVNKKNINPTKWSKNAKIGAGITAGAALIGTGAYLAKKHYDKKNDKKD